MIFLTFNDPYNGIYKSQVIDVCAFLEKEFSVRVNLVAFVSLRTYREQKKLITSQYARAYVFPMFPKVKYWKWNSLSLFCICIFLKESVVWSRGPFATWMALFLKKRGGVKKVLFDARGAYQAELTEYNVTGESSVRGEIEKIERLVLNHSDAQLAVSHALIKWWDTKYQFRPQQYAVIPCTLSNFFGSYFTSKSDLEQARQKAGFQAGDIILMFSGSSAGWQSFELIDDILYRLFLENEQLKLIFLSNEKPDSSKIFQSFPDRIVMQWLKPEEVKNRMCLADYGILIREKSVTNQVASPVKFAEYLSCGLQVLISDQIGDFSRFVEEQACGIQFKEGVKLVPVSFEQKWNTNQIALRYFTKEADTNKVAYKRLLDFLSVS